MSVQSLEHLPTEICGIIFNHLKDSDLSSCLLVNKAWNRAVQILQEVYKKKLETADLLIDYSFIKHGCFMAGTFNSVYNGAAKHVSFKQAFEDWTIYEKKSQRSTSGALTEN